jgi:hypothetical protein
MERRPEGFGFFLKAKARCAGRHPRRGSTFPRR